MSAWADHRIKILKENSSVCRLWYTDPCTCFSSAIRNRPKAANSSAAARMALCHCTGGGSDGAQSTDKDLGGGAGRDRPAQDRGKFTRGEIEKALGAGDTRGESSQVGIKTEQR